MTRPDFSALDADNIVAFLADIFERRGAEAYLGEDVTMSQHMLQGAYLAERSGAPEEVVAAALLHDIGHFTSEFPDDALENNVNNYHDAAGAAVLAPFFPPLVTECVRQHVAAKRYLCAVEPEYRAALSDASVHSLGLQGGPMTAEEARAFARQPALEHILAVRRWDDGGKDAGTTVPPFAHYLPLLRRVVERFRRLPEDPAAT